jgi:rubredoxin
LCASKQMSFLDDDKRVKTSGPVECLGITFETDEARREYFLEKLAEKLKDPEFRKIEGFPIGSGEDILALSDPPYYTACPNPFIEDFIEYYGKPYDPNEHYNQKPFAADVSEGRNDPIYNAHTYHTKVPHKAIMRYILHYTEPEDIIFDGFCGTGMTGVAAQLCGDRATVESLGYRVDEHGVIYQKETDPDGKTVWQPFSKLGVRRAVLNDLSPAATFIAYNYTRPVDANEFKKEAKQILSEVEKECGWMYETTHTDGEVKGRIKYTVWSDVFMCPECSKEVVFWDAAVDRDAGKIHGEFYCPHCNARLTKHNMDFAWVTRFDEATNQTVRQAEQVPVLINYSVGRKRFEKAPDAFDLALVQRIDDEDIPYWFPTDRMPAGDKTSDPFNAGITHVHHFFTRRNLMLLSSVLSKIRSRMVLFVFTGLLTRSSKQARFLGKNYFHGGGGWVGTSLPGTLYIPSLNVEVIPTFTLGNRIRSVERIMNHRSCTSCLTTQSTSKLSSIEGNSVFQL